MPIVRTSMWAASVWFLSASVTSDSAMTASAWACMAVCTLPSLNCWPALRDFSMAGKQAATIPSDFSPLPTCCSESESLEMACSTSAVNACWSGRISLSSAASAAVCPGESNASLSADA
jgi:hypothetical protein